MAGIMARRLGGTSSLTIMECIHLQGTCVLSSVLCTVVFCTESTPQKEDYWWSMVMAPLQTRLAVSAIVVAVCCRLFVAAVAGDGLPGWCRDDPSEGETTAETETALMVLDGVLPPALLAALARAAPSIRATMGDSTAWYDLSADEGAAAAAARSVPEEVVRHVAAWLPQLNGSRWAGVEWWVQRRHHAAPPLYLHYDVAGRKRAEARRRRDRGSRSGACASRRPWRGAFTHRWPSPCPQRNSREAARSGVAAAVASLHTVCPSLAHSETHARRSVSPSRCQPFAPLRARRLLRPMQPLVW